MKNLVALALALSLAAGPVWAQNIGGYSNAIGGGSNGSTKVTVNTPPNDLLQGPTTISSPADQIVNSQGAGAVGLQITGTCSSLSGLVRASIDGSNYFNVPAFNSNTGLAVPAGTAITATGSWFIPAAGWPNVEFHPTALTASCTFSLNSSAGSIQPLITPDGASAVNVQPSTSGGLSVKHIIVANNTTSIAVKASAGQLYKMVGSSISAATPVWAKLYNASQGSTTCGSGTPVSSSMIPAPGASGGGTNIDLFPGVPFSTAITVCITAGLADADTTAPAASTYTLDLYYK